MFKSTNYINKKASDYHIDNQTPMIVGSIGFEPMTPCL